MTKPICAVAKRVRRLDRCAGGPPQILRLVDRALCDGIARRPKASHRHKANDKVNEEDEFEDD
jgi:hypothetical protein